MRRWIGIGSMIAACALAGCNMSVPMVTPTVAATRTSIASTTLINPTNTRTSTPDATQTSTLTPSDTPTLTTTSTQSSTPTRTISPTDTFTYTPTITLIPSETPIPSPTPLPFIPTETPTIIPSSLPTQTFTLIPTGTASPSLTPSDTRIPPPTITPSPRPPATLDTAAINTEQARINADNERQVAATITREYESIAATLTALAPTADVGATITAQVNQIVATMNALISAATERAPTLDATPTFITAAPGTTEPDVALTPENATPVFGGDPDGRGDVITITPIAVPPATTEIPVPFFIPPSPLGFENLPPAARSFALSTDGSLGGAYLDLPGGAFTFAQNPVNPNLYARVDTNGLLFEVNDVTTGGARMSASPFSAFAPDTPERNNARVTQVKWSPNGQFLAFLIDTTRDGSTDNDLQNDGIYFYEPSVSAPHPLFRSCPPDLSCQLVRHDAGPFEFRPLGFVWNNSSTALLIRLQLENNTTGFTVVAALTSTNPGELPRIYRYEYATWSVDGTRVLASGAGEDGMVGLRWIDPLTGSIEPIFNAGVSGLTINYGVQRPNGGLVALGSNGAGGWRIYDSAGNALTGEIGASAPTRVEWSPDRSTVLVVTFENGTPRYFIARTNGGIEEITGYVAGSLAIEWVGG